MKNADDELLRRAAEARDRAYAPYSQVHVGAAARDREGNVYTGCNVENASLGLTLCAERVALFHAVAAGASEIETLAFVSNHPGVTSPCGACRQVLVELAPRARIVFGDESGVRTEWASPGDLLPEAFTPGWEKK
jgi:cytidine deaminase